MKIGLGFWKWGVKVFVTVPNKADYTLKADVEYAFVIAKTGIYAFRNIEGPELDHFVGVGLIDTGRGWTLYFNDVL